MLSSLFHSFISTGRSVSAYEQAVLGASELSSERFSHTFSSKFEDDDRLVIDGENIVMVKVENVDGVTTELIYGATVGDVVKTLGINVDDYIITPDLDTKISDNLLVKLVKVEKTFETVTEIVPFRSEQVNDSSMYVGTSLVTQEGQNGVKEITILRTFHDGQMVEEKVTDQKMVTPVVNKITKVGTRERIDFSTVPGLNNSCVQWDSYIDQITGSDAERYWLKSVMRCESGCYAGANNGGLYKGLMQFSERTFAGYGGTNIWDGYQQLRISLTIYRSGGAAHHWPACTRLVN